MYRSLVALTSLALIACASTAREQGSPAMYVHAPTGLAFPAHIGDLDRNQPTTQNPYTPGSVGVGYHKAGQQSILVVLMPIVDPDKSAPSAFLRALLRISPDTQPRDARNVLAICDGVATEFSYLAVQNRHGHEAFFAAHLRGHLLYMRGLGAPAPPHTPQDLLAGLLSALTWPCMVSAVF